MGPTESALLAAVERSPQAAAAHDRAGWVRLFTGDGRLEDPVGSRPHVISRFCADADEVEARSMLAFSLPIGNHFIAADHGPRGRKEVLELAKKQLLA